MNGKRRFYRAAGSLAASVVMIVSGVTPAFAAPSPKLDKRSFITAPSRTQISFRYSDGRVFGTSNQHESRPGLSIVKLYIADFVFKYGDRADYDRTTDMLRTSNDATASSLYAKYPNSIANTAGRYRLSHTHAAPHWGNSTTSTSDSVKYLEAKKREGWHNPVLAALATAAPIAADGYAQNYGTAVLPGVIGSKWGWYDNRSAANSSASFGVDFSVAASTYGPASQLTNDVKAAFSNRTSFKRPDRRCKNRRKCKPRPRFPMYNGL